MIASFSRLLLLLLWLLPLAGSADEPPAVSRPTPKLPVVPQPAMRPGPWIGLEVAKLTEAMHAQVADIPRGVGFIVTGVEEEGPAARAGLRRFDILWKFEDQLLVNEAQFGTLIQMKAPGDRVTMSILRGGSPQLVELELSEAPERPRTAGLDPTEIPIYPSGVPGMPRQVVYPRERTAEVTRPDGSIARLRYEGDEPVVRIEKSGGEVIFDGPVRQDGRFAVPDEWRCAVGALMRAMHRATSDDWKPRRPRPRVVVPPNRGG